MEIRNTITERGDKLGIFKSEGDMDYEQIRVRIPLDEDEPVVVFCYAHADDERPTERYVFDRQDIQFRGVQPQRVNRGSVPEDVQTALNNRGFATLPPEGLTNG